ncbi:MAG: hypothetical protein H0W89_01415 [Candidatus Levybacteria bacterium]|nr:hypothetical protein [Candidatus Levybacteria bacterium]
MTEFHSIPEQASQPENPQTGRLKAWLDRSKENVKYNVAHHPLLAGSTALLLPGMAAAMFPPEKQGVVFLTGVIVEGVTAIVSIPGTNQGSSNGR